MFKFSVREMTIKQIKLSRIVECAEECLVERAKRMKRDEPIGLCFNAIRYHGDLNKLYTIREASELTEAVVSDSIEQLFYDL
jgi:hypothetical protein